MEQIINYFLDSLVESAKEGKVGEASAVTKEKYCKIIKTLFQAAAQNNIGNNSRFKINKFNIDFLYHPINEVLDCVNYFVGCSDIITKEVPVFTQVIIDSNYITLEAPYFHDLFNYLVEISDDDSITPYQDIIDTLDEITDVLDERIAFKMAFHNILCKSKSI